ncbi:hypothetical protein [Anaerosporobacter sp.]|uniref:hypothetical protein n=1 Tax=Anaerosporobacter sp. TaxID=1872529 RepID=UPI00286F23B1|nr:hypothetical protein [Anaerosporobacter sp.]
MGKLEGSTLCKNCGKEIKWCYLLRQKLSSSRTLDVETIAKGTIILNSSPLDNIIKVHCNNCDVINEITQEK